MKHIDAHWEKRNMGIEAVELIIDESDTLEEVNKAITQLDKEYQVIRAPVGRIDLFMLLQKQGFVFMEAMYRCFVDLPGSILSDADITKTGYKKAESKSSIKTIINNINEGMFKEDRVSLDPFFSPDQARARYVGMLEDYRSLNPGAFCIMHDNSEVGFFLLRELQEDVYDVLLTGLYPAYRSRGLGRSIALQPIICAKDIGSTRLYSSVSTNNKLSLSIHIKCGFIPDHIRYIFAKHCRT